MMGEELCVKNGSHKLDRVVEIVEAMARFVKDTNEDVKAMRKSLLEMESCVFDSLRHESIARYNLDQSLACLEEKHNVLSHDVTNLTQQVRSVSKQPLATTTSLLSPTTSNGDTYTSISLSQPNLNTNNTNHTNHTTTTRGGYSQLRRKHSHQTYVPSRTKPPPTNSNASCYDIVLDYAAVSTCHGVSHMFQLQNASRIRRAFWLILCFASFAAVFCLCGIAVHRYLSYPSSSQIQQFIVDSMQFPAMTICGTNLFKKTVISDMIDSGAVPDFSSFQNFVKQQVRLGHPYTDGIVVTNGSDISAMLEVMDIDQKHLLEMEWERQKMQINWEDLLLTAGPQLNDSLVAAYIMDYSSLTQIELELDVKTFVHYENHKVCHTLIFKKLQSHELVNSTQIRQETVILELNSSSLEYETAFEQHAVPGFSFVFHSMGTIPVYNHAQLIHNSTKYHEVKLSKKVTHNLPTPYTASDCESLDSGELVYFKEYSAQACRLECVGGAMAKHCGCRRIGHPGDGVPVCNQSNLAVIPQCIRQIKFKEECSYCRPACDTITYNAELFSYGKLETQGTMYMIVYFKDYEYTEITQSAVYPLASMFADIGGYMGLLIGASVMTLMEIFDLSVRALVNKVKGIMRKKISKKKRVDRMCESNAL